jgi:hypothetical protein
MIARGGKPTEADVDRVCREVVTEFAHTTAAARFRETHSPQAFKIDWATRQVQTIKVCAGSGLELRFSRCGGARCRDIEIFD